ncbi:metalloprotease P-II-like protein [Leptotrombidium deliense]|uniref:Metalloprotease P-II-like protein n=1 Tax=Leptotrombidium deliense TaxID=299467 RepID=A0A443SIN8_9ACAR|nr:metalloprotease P-II-like protein [Leptotrombidium deliense]
MVRKEDVFMNTIVGEENKEECLFLKRHLKITRQPLHICDGIIQGFVELNENYFQVIHDSSKNIHKIVKVDITERQAFCGQSEVVTEERLIIGRQMYTFKKLYLPILIVVDHRSFLKLGANISSVEFFVTRIVEEMRKLYEKPFNVNVTLAGIVYWDKKDKIQIDSNATVTLLNFGDYNANILRNKYKQCYRTAHLFTAQVFQEQTLGLAPINLVCEMNGDFAVGLTSIFERTPLEIVNTIVHETGHNLGLPHDADDCSCVDGENMCIMRAYDDTKIVHSWSQCSLNTFHDEEERGTHGCLFSELPQKCTNVSSLQKQEIEISFNALYLLIPLLAICVAMTLIVVIYIVR